LVDSRFLLPVAMAVCHARRRFRRAMKDGRSLRAAAAVLVAVLSNLRPATPTWAAGFQVLTVGKTVRFENRGDPLKNCGTVVVGRDRALQTVHDPSCPTTSVVEIEAYLQSTFRDAILAHVNLDCAKWSATRTGFRYKDKTGTVRSIH